MPPICTLKNDSNSKFYFIYIYIYHNFFFKKTGVPESTHPAIHLMTHELPVTGCVQEAPSNMRTCDLWFPIQTFSRGFKL